MDIFREHCREIGDKDHQALRSNDKATLLPAYRAAMNRSGDKTLSVESKPYGPISYHASFTIGEVLRKRRLVFFLSLQMANLS